MQELANHFSCMAMWALSHANLVGGVSSGRLHTVMVSLTKLAESAMTGQFSTVICANDVVYGSLIAKLMEPGFHDVQGWAFILG